jgi:hypothetical protein
MKKFSLILLLLLVSPILAFSQSTGDRCRIYIVNHEELQEDVPSGEKEEDGSTIPKGVKVLGRFTTVVAEERYTTKLFDFPGENLTIVASVYYTDESMHTKLTWNSVLLGVLISEKGKEGKAAVVSNSNAEFPYLPHSKMKAFTGLFVGKGEYSVVLECECFKDAELANGFRRAVCAVRKKRSTKQKALPTIKRKGKIKAG